MDCKAIVVVAILSLFISFSCRAEMTRADHLAEWVFVSVTLADWHQTRQISKQCNTGYVFETNMVLRSCPSRAEVDRYFAAVIPAHMVITRLIPIDMRKAWHGFTLGISMSSVYSNFAVGVEF